MTDNVKALEDLLAEQAAIEEQRKALELQEASIIDQETEILKTMEQPPVVETPPAAPPPVVVPPPPVATDPPPVDVPAPAPVEPRSRLQGQDGDSITPVAGTYKYGTTLLVATTAIDGRVWPAGDYFVDVTLAAGPIVITPASLGVTDPIYGIVKQLYLVSVASDAPAAPAPTPAAPTPAAPTPAAPTPAAPAPAPTSVDGPLLTIFESVTGLHCGYRSLPEEVLASLPQGAITPPGPLSLDAGTTGAQEDIGMINDTSYMAVVANDVRAEKYNSNVSLLAATMPIHTADKVTGQPVIIDDHPTASFQDGSGQAITNPDPNGNAAGWNLDLQHEAHFTLVEGLRAIKDKDQAALDRVLNEMTFQSMWEIMMLPSSGRINERCIFSTRMTMTDVRGAGWGFLVVAQTACLQRLAILTGMGSMVDPRAHASFNRIVAENARWFAETFLPDTPNYIEPFTPENDPYYYVPPGRLKNTRGIFTSMDTYQLGAGVVWIAPWQHHFFTSAWQMVSGMIDSGSLEADATTADYARRIANAGASFAARLCGDKKKGGVDYRVGCHAYIWGVGTKNADGFCDYFATDEEEIAANFVGQPTLPDDNIIRYHMGDGHDGTESAGLIGIGYLANFMPALARGVDMGAPGCAEAWERFAGSQNFKDSQPLQAEQGGVFYNFAFTPKGVVLGGTVDTEPTGGGTDPDQPDEPKGPVVTEPDPVVTADMPQISGTGDAAYAALKTIEPNTWAAFVDSDTVGRALLQNAADTGYREYGADGNPTHAVMAAWSGGDRVGPNFNGVGASHGDSNFNGTYRINLESFMCSIPVKPSVITQAECDEIKADNPNWFTWGQISIDGKTDYFVESSGPFAGRKMWGPLHTYGAPMLNAAGTKLCVRPLVYDLVNNSMTKDPTIPNGNGFTFGAQSVKWNGFGIGLGFRDAYTYTQIDPETAATVAEGIINQPYEPGEAAGFVFDAMTYSIVIGDTIHSIRLAPSRDDPVTYPAPETWMTQMPVVAGVQPITVTTENLKTPWAGPEMFTWDSSFNPVPVMQQGTCFTRNGVLYIAAKDWSYFLTWNPLTGECGKVVMKGALPPTKTNGAYGRLMHYADRDVVILINDIDEPIYAFTVA